MPVSLSDFSNDKYLLLRTLYDNQLKVGNECYVPLSQQEISVVVGFSKPKTNQLMKELSSQGYISAYKGVRGKYSITEDGLRVISVFEGE